MLRTSLAVTARRRDDLRRGAIWKERFPPIGKFAPGVVDLHRKSGAEIVPMAIWVGARHWPRRRYIIEIGRPLRKREG